MTPGNGQNGRSKSLARPAPLDVASIFDGKNVALIGATGFVGKVALSLLLRRYPNIGRVYVLVRPGAGNTPEDRFFDKVATSPVFDPVREIWLASFWKRGEPRSAATGMRSWDSTIA